MAEHDPIARVTLPRALAALAAGRFLLVAFQLSCAAGLAVWGRGLMLFAQLEGFETYHPVRDLIALISSFAVSIRRCMDLVAI